MSIGFKCIATDVSTGEGVVFDSGEIVPAVRSSMAIPSLFTPVNYNGRKFVDGGIVRNFPVSDAKKMGADIIIGSNVAGSLLPKEKINNIFQVLLQIAFFREDEDAIHEKKLCNIYVPHHLDEYNMGSFASAEAIINEGVKMGDSLYPRFKKLADSLNAIYGKQPPKRNLLPSVDSVKITNYEIHGLDKTKESFFLHRMQFENYKWYTAKLLSSKIRRAFGTRYYSRIVYSLQPLPDGSCKIVFDIEENPFTFAKLGIQYNSFTGISLIGNLTSRDFFTPHSRSFVTVNIGENMRIRGEHLQNFGKFKTFSVAGRIQAESLGFTTYKDFNKEGSFRRSSFLADVNTHWTFRRNFQMGVGTYFEAYHYKPDIPSQFYLRGHTNLFTSYGFLKINTLSNSIYPQQGTKVNADIGFVYDQRPSLQYYSNKERIINLDSLGFKYANFWRSTLSVEHYQPVGRKITFIAGGQAGLNFHEKARIVNDFVIGGLTNTFRNQITFAGLNECSFFTS
ncbi:MAG TPA: patatin-like phospholipase family protein, partial [Chitinophagaceae bacterium]|nr:patatin-like phospholipase family protein [Chitinophagaceae bacterium]